MARRPQTATTIKSRVKRGLGRGEGEGYKPWLHRREVPSNGRSAQIIVFDRKRTHCVLSMHERNTLMLLAWDEDVLDINEQYPLLPITRTQAIAAERGIPHPHERGYPRIRTLDFKVKHRTLGVVALSNKPVDLLGKRQQDLLELERAYAHEEGWRWSLVTEREVPQIRARNLGILNENYDLQLSDIGPAQQNEIAGKVMNEVTKGAFLSQACNVVSDSLGLASGSALAVSWNYLARKRWSTDLDVPLVPWIMRPIPMPPADTGWASGLTWL
jgi:hypothetical protein